MFQVPSLRVCVNGIVSTSSVPATSGTASAASTTGTAKGSSSSVAGGTAAATTSAGATSAGTHVKVVSFAVGGFAAIAAGFALF